MNIPNKLGAHDASPRATEEKEKAVAYWKQLTVVAQFDENKRYAQFNLMQYYFETNDSANAQAYAEKILRLNELEERIKWDAYYILAKTAEQQKDLEKAAKAFKALEKAPRGTRCRSLFRCTTKTPQQSL